MSLTELKKKYEQAKIDYNRGYPTMTDEEFDELEEEIRRNFPDDSEFTYETGIQDPVEKSSLLPVPMPSLKKIKTQEELARWKEKNQAKEYIITAKLDGVSAEWVMSSKTLLTRHDGITGKDISIHSNIRGLVSGTSFLDDDDSGSDFIVRGEIMLSKRSKLADGAARNIAAGILNRKERTNDSGELSFVAYEICKPVNISPLRQLKILESLGFEVCRHVVLQSSDLNSNNLLDIFESFEREDENHFKYDGVVIYPDIPRPDNFSHEIKNSSIVLPDDRRAWKVRRNQIVMSTTVIDVEWNVGFNGKMTPVLIIEPVIIDDVKISRVTAHNAKVINSNKIGQGSIVSISRSNDTIPYLHGVIESTEAQMPDCDWEWKGETDIYEVGMSDERLKAEIKKSLDALGAENVGPAMIEKLFNSGFNNLFKIYAAPAKKFEIMDRVGPVMAQKIYNGLRAKKNSWDLSDLMVASLCFPQLVGKSKLSSYLLKYPDWNGWNRTDTVFGISSDVVGKIVACVPKFQDWYEKFRKIADIEFSTSAEEFLSDDYSAPQAARATPVALPVAKNRPVVAFTGGINKKIQQDLDKAGYDSKDSVTKNVVLLIYTDKIKGSTNYQKAEKYGIRCIKDTDFSLSDLQ